MKKWGSLLSFGRTSVEAVAAMPLTHFQISASTNAGSTGAEQEKEKEIESNNVQVSAKDEGKQIQSTSPVWQLLLLELSGFEGERRMEALKTKAGAGRKKGKGKGKDKDKSKGEEEGDILRIRELEKGEAEIREQGFVVPPLTCETPFHCPHTSFLVPPLEVGLGSALNKRKGRKNTLTAAGTVEGDRRSYLCANAHRFIGMYANNLK